MPKPLRGIMFDNTSGDLSNNLGLGDAALTHLTSGADNIAVGYNALQTTTTGSSNVAIGNQAASDSNNSNTITINATGISLDTTNDSRCFVAPIRNASAANALYYNSTTNEITWDASGGGGGGGGSSNLVSGNLLVTGTIEAKGDLLTPIHSAEGSSQSVITDLVPSTNPLMTKGMLWMNEAQDASSAWSSVASMDVSRQFVGAAALGGKLYAVGGWADGYSNAVFRMLEHIKAPTKGLVGPWAHKYPHMAEPGPAIGFLQECLRWWDHWLKDIDTGVMDEPQLRCWIEDSAPPRTYYRERPGRWVAEPSWPSPNIAPRKFFLNPGTLDDKGGSAQLLSINSPMTVGAMAGQWCPHGLDPDLPGDQRAEAGGSLVFDSPPLEESK